MRVNSKLPKTFSIYGRKGTKEGYLRFISTQLQNGNIIFMETFEQDINKASKFVNFDNVKERAHQYAEKMKLDEVKIIDDRLMKIYYVKKNK